MEPATAPRFVIEARTMLFVAFALSLLYPRAASAQEWRWRVVVQSPGRSPVNAQSRVVLSSRDLVLTYTASVESRDVPITSCRVGINDIASVRAVENAGHPFLFVVLKPRRTAICSSGSQPIALVPIVDDPSAKTAIATITRACCGTAVAAARPTPSTPAARPTPSATAASASPVPVPPADWVENEGLFAFVRVRNRDSGPLTITSGEVVECRNAAYGCGRFIDHPVTLAPGAVSTLATIMSGNPGNAVTFTYRYEALSGTTRFTESGRSRKAADDPRVAMSAQEIRSAEALAVAGIRGRTAPNVPNAPPVLVGPKLIRRGTTRLGIGQKGVALVRLRIGANGMPQNASIASISNRALVAAALETAVSSTYEPAKRDGQPVDGDYVATFQFDGSDPALSSIPVWRRSPSPSSASSPSPSPSVSPSASPSPRATPSPSPSAGPAASPSAAAATGRTV